MKFPNIPPQHIGDFYDVVSIQCANTINMAIANFNKVVQRLIAVTNWYSLSSDVETKFTVYDT